MSLKSKVPILMCLLLAVSIFIYAQVPTAHSWGWDTHYFIETKAEGVFSDSSFFSNYHSTLYTWCIMPDQDPSFMPDGGGDKDWHYLDAHSYDPLVYTGGELPWAMEWIFDNIVQYLKDGNWGTAAELMGAICHFTGDATMPLHATYDYWIGGMHSAYETAVNTHIGEISIPNNYVPQKLDDITNAALATLEESFSFTGNTEDDLSYWLRLGISWNDTIKSITENRVRAGVQFTANVWYTAMIHAGLAVQAPTLTSPSDGSTTTDNTPTFNWTSVSGASSYDFQLASDNDFTTNAFTVKDLSTTSYTLVAPLTNGEWYWHVRTGDNSTDVGLWSQIRSFTVSASTRSVNVSIYPSSQSGANGATLTYTVTVANTGNVSDTYSLTPTDTTGWSPSVSPTSLTVSPGSSGTSTLSVTVPLNAIGGTSDTVTVTAAGTGVSGSGNCIARAIAAPPPTDTTPPPAPSLISPTNGANITDNTPTLNWSDISDPSGVTCDISIARDVGFVSIALQKTGLTTSTYELTPAEALAVGIYYWRARAVDGAGNIGSWSENWSFTVSISPRQGVRISILPEENEAENGHSTTFTVTMTNTGNVADNYDLTVGDNSGWGSTLSDNSFLNVENGASRTATLTVIVPSSAENRAQDMITVTARSRTDNAIESSTTCTATAIKAPAPPAPSGGVSPLVYVGAAVVIVVIIAAILIPKPF